MDAEALQMSLWLELPKWINLPLWGGQGTSHYKPNISLLFGQTPSIRLKKTYVSLTDILHIYMYVLLSHVF